MSGRHWEQNKEATVYVGNLDERFAEPLMWELMTQMGPVVNVHMPMDRVSRIHQGFGFVEFDTPESADYASRCLNGIRLYGKPVRVNKASADRQRATDIGAELFVSNLDPQVDEKILYDTFAQFGRLVAAPNVVRDQNNVSKGYGFVNFDSFEASDAARAAMQGEYVLSKQIAVEYAYKKDGKGERHGDDAERKLAAEGKKHNVVPEIQPLPSAFLMSRPNPANSSAAGTTTTPATPTAPAGTNANATPLAASSHSHSHGSSGSSLPNGGPGGPPSSAQQALPNGANGLAPSPTGGFPPRGPGGGPGGGGYPPYQQQQQQQQQQGPPPHFQRQQGGPPYGGGPGVPPPMPAGFGGRGGMSGPPPPYGGGRGVGGGPGLPMAPSGLPARPPPGGVSGVGGVGGGPPGAGGYRSMPPPGFSTGANGVPMVPPLPGAVPGQQGYNNGMPPPPPPPAGFGRR